MNLKDYQEATKRTMKDLGYQLDICHMIMGMTSELYEIDEAKDVINLGEEYTDIFWYLSNYCNLIGVDLSQTKGFTFGKYNNKLDYCGEYILKLQSSISKLADIEKKEMVYKKVRTLDEKLEKVIEVMEALSDCYTHDEINPYDAMQKNIDKLRKRFPEKFTEDLANNRNLEKERKALEG